MDNTEQKIIDDVKWLVKSFPSTPDIKFLEASIQSFAIFMGINPSIQWDEHDLIKLSLAGFIAARARMLDEDKFTSIYPHIYYQVAQYLVERDYKGIPDTPENFESFMRKIIITK